MADQKISEFAAHSALIDADLFAVVDSTAGETKKALLSSVKSVLKTYFDGLYTTAAAVIDDNTLIKGDGGSRGVQKTGITVDDDNNVSGIGTLGCGAITATSPIRSVVSSNPKIQLKRSGNTVANGMIEFLGSDDTVDWAIEVQNVNGLFEISFEGTTYFSLNRLSSGAATFLSTLTCGAITCSDDLIMSTNAKGIRANTSDDSDNQAVYLSGGGAQGASRGSCISLFGNEYTGNEGRMNIVAGYDAADGSINFYTGNSVLRLTIGYDGNFLFTGNIVGSPLMLRNSTSDGSDNSYVQIQGGGAGGVTRGGYVEAHGNEHTSYEGCVRLIAGTVAGANKGEIRFITAGAEQAVLANDGVMTFANFPVTPSSAPSSDYEVTNKKYVDDNVGVAVLHFYKSGISEGTTNILGPWKSAGAGDAINEENWIMVVPKSGTIRNLYVNADSNLLDVSTVFTVRKNGADQTLTCTLDAEVTTGNDTSHSFSVAAGDLISVKVVVGAGNNIMNQVNVAMELI